MKQRCFEMTRDDLEKCKSNGIEFIGAGLYQVMGPQYRDIFYFNKRPLVIKEREKFSTNHVLFVIGK
jgi:hypothetical protein